MQSPQQRTAGNLVAAGSEQLYAPYVLAGLGTAMLALWARQSPLISAAAGAGVGYVTWSMMNQLTMNMAAPFALSSAGLLGAQYAGQPYNIQLLSGALGGGAGYWYFNPKCL